MNIKCNKNQLKLGRQFSILNSQFSIPRSGMTLVELLVAVSIMVMLVAISVPMFKPMLESRKTAEGARTVALALQRARVKAMETGIPHGIEFQRYTNSGTASTAAPALQMYLVSVGKPYTGNPGDTVSVISHSTPGVNCLDISGASQWGTTVESGDKIQFDYKGKYYELFDDGTDWFPRLPIDRSGVPPLYEYPQEMSDVPVPFRIIRQPRVATRRLSLIPPATMPRGTVVDLRFSGFDYTNGVTNFYGDIFDTGSGPGGSVVVMFAPNGTVDRVYYRESGTLRNDIDDPTRGAAKLIYFCVGEWDRQTIDANCETLAEDGRNNLQVASNFWVTINPRTGEVRTAEMNPVTFTGAPTVSMVSESRRFAGEHFVNIGGF